MDYIAFGYRVRYFRQQKHLTQSELAELADISHSFMGHIERGSRVASLETLMRLCSVLDVTPNDLLGGEIAVESAGLPERISLSPQYLLQGIVNLLRMQEQGE